MALPSVSVSLISNGNEADGSPFVFMFERTGETTVGLDVGYNLTPAVDSEGSYGGVTSGTIRFPSGSSQTLLSLPPNSDSVISLGSSFIAKIIDSASYSLITGKQTAVGTLTPRPPVVTLAVSPEPVLEDGTRSLVYTFTRTGSLVKPLKVRYGITGNAGATDYTGATPGSSKTITFAPGSSTATVNIDPSVDDKVEVDETVILTLADGVGYVVGTPVDVVGRIINDDVAIANAEPIVSLAVSSEPVLEDGTSSLVYTFTRTGSTVKSLKVRYGITGTANSSDYTGATPGSSKTITFAPGSSTATVNIDPRVDSLVEGDETVILTLAGGVGYLVGTTLGVVGRIGNDDGSTFDSTLADGQSSLTLIGTADINGTGNQLDNIIKGNEGSNILDGGDGVDILSGLSGADTFVFSTQPTFLASTADHITDFIGSQGDRIQINKSAFGMGPNVPSSVVTSSSSQLSTASTTANTFVYDSTTGHLYWNQNGSAAGFGSGGVFAILDNKAAFNSSFLLLA